jgi:hypothetical protein
LNEVKVRGPEYHGLMMNAEIAFSKYLVKSPFTFQAFREIRRINGAITPLIDNQKPVNSGA